MSAAQADRRRRVVIVSRVRRNPYVQLLQDGLAQPDLGLSVSVSDTLSLKWMWHRRREVDVLHVHWLDLLLSYPTWWWTLKRLVTVVGALLLAKLSGVRLVYTVHNVWQHEGQNLWATHCANRAMFRLADAVHVHDEGTANELARRWGRRHGVHVIAHGNYVTAYPNTRTREEARQHLELSDDAYVYAFIGRIRPYKGLEDLVDAFGQIEDERARLVVAGEAQEDQFAAQVRAYAERDRRIKMVAEFVAEDALQDYFAACDICVLPYRHVTTSGAAILAFSFGVPIIAPDMGCLGEMVGADERGLLYEAGSVASLRDAMIRAKLSDTGAWREASRRYAASLDWRTIARQHAEMYDYATGETV